MDHSAPLPTSRPIPIRDNRQPNSESGYKISVRFGDQILQAGFTSVPNLVLNHYAELGITPAEMLFTIHMWQFRWTERDPYPSLTTIADKMDVSWRQAHRYANSLKGKGFLIIKSRQEPGRGQVTSEYDFEPLIKAVLKLDKDGPPSQEAHLAREQDSTPVITPLTKMTGGGMTDLTEAPLTQMSDEEYEEQEDPKQEDANLSNIRKAASLRILEEQNPTNPEAKARTPRQLETSSPTSTRAETTLSSNPHQSPREETQEERGKRGERAQGFSSIGATLARSSLKLPAKPYGEERQVIMDYVARFAKEFNDQASLKTSTTRAFHLYERSGLPLGAFIGRMYEAHAITKESAASVPRKPVNPSQTGAVPKGRPAKNKMAYFYACLEDRLGLRKTKDIVAEKQSVQKSS